MRDIMLEKYLTKLKQGDIFPDKVKENKMDESGFEVNPLLEPDNRRKVFQCINKEAEHQDRKWGNHKEQSVPGYLLIMKKELAEAEEGWMKSTEGRDSVLSEILQVVTVGIRCLEQYGTTGCPASTRDKTS